MKEEIIKILREIEKVEDTKEVLFPLLYKLSKIKSQIGNFEFKNLMLEDKEVSKIFKIVEEKMTKNVLDNNEIGGELKMWGEYKNKRISEENEKRKS